MDNIKKDMNFKEFIDLLGWSKSRFYDNIDRICSKDVYDIDIGKFKKAGETKEDYIKDDNHFCFKKEWVDIAFVLFSLFMENPFNRRNSKLENITLEEIRQYNVTCMKMIEQELPTNQRREIQMHPVYAATLMETKIMENISEKVQLLLLSISKMPVETRVEIWMNFDQILNQQIIYSYLSTIDAKEKMEQKKGDLFKNQLFGEYEHASLDKLLAQVLKNEMDSENATKRVVNIYYISNKRRKLMKLFKTTISKQKLFKRDYTRDSEEEIQIESESETNAVSYQALIEILFNKYIEEFD